MKVNNKIGKKKIIQQIPAENFELILKAAELENRSRNNFVINAALEKARKIIDSKKEEDSQAA